MQTSPGEGAGTVRARRMGQMAWVFLVPLTLAWGAQAANAQAAGAQTSSPQLSGAPPAAHGATVPVVMLSDIHFEPYRDPARLERLRRAPVTQWHAILAESDSPTQAADFARLSAACKTRGLDTAWPLLESSLAAAHERSPRASFVTVSGDLLSHSFDCRFRALVPHATGADYTAFAAKTIAYIALELRNAFPHTPVYIALGNNDSGCKDYRETPDSTFLHSVVADLDPASGRKAALHLFPATGDYSAKMPRPIARGRLIVLQDVFLSREYTECDGKPDAAPGAAQLAWLRAQLAAARSAHEQVWVMAHIPPGVNVYSTISRARDVCAGQSPEMYLGDEKLADVLTEFSDVIRLSVFAHSHMDEFHLLRAEAAQGDRAVAVKQVPAISPVNGNQPAFTLADVDTRTATLVDYSVVAGSNQTGVATQWSEQYRFSKTYGLADYTVESLRPLLAEFDADRQGRTAHSAAYQHNFFVGGGGTSNRGGLLGLVWPAYVCSMQQHTVEGYRGCLCAAP